MRNELEKYEGDGFDAFETSDESNRVIKGALVKFTNEGTWVTGDDELSSELELVVVDIARVVQKWPPDEGPPIETRMLGPGEKFPNITALNEATPQSEWRTGPDGVKKGPWQACHIVYFLNPKTIATAAG
jgi:hypothetical protein